MGFPKWLKKVGVETGKAAGIAALETAKANPVIALAIQITNSSLAHGQVASPELIKTLNTLLIPAGYCVVELPAQVE